MKLRKNQVGRAAFVVLAFVVVEKIARIEASIDHPFGRVSPAVIADPILHHTYIPSFDAEGMPFALHINRQSWPEQHDIEERKPPGVFRVFMVGDSNTQGYVDPEFRWVTRVGQALNHRRNTQMRYEVINAGRVSYSPVLYYLHIKHQILKFSPDLVVINVDMSDCRDDAIYRLTMRTDAGGDVLAVTPPERTLASQGLVLTATGVCKLTSSQRISMWLVEHSTCMAYLQLAVNRFAGLFPNAHRAAVAVGTSGTNAVDNLLRADWLEKTWSREMERNVDFSMTMLGKTIDLLKEHGVKCIIVGVPHYPQFAGESSTRPFEVLADTARQHNVLFLNLYEVLAPFIAHTGQTEYYRPGDTVHFNVRGNQLWADAFLQFWEKYNTDLTAQL